MLRQLVVGAVQDIFNDRARGERPVVRSSAALFEPGSEIWRVHGDVTTMMIGGIGALLLQMLNPAALAGVWEHSSFRDDMLGRLRRTARFIAVTTYADASSATALIDRVRRVHDQVRGTMPNGMPYAASDPRLLAWVHVCEATCFLNAWVAFGDPSMSKAAQDRYFAQAAVVAQLLGADPVPRSRREADALIQEYRPSLVANARTREVAELILHPPLPAGLKPAQALIGQAAVGILPSWAKEMHGRAAPSLASPLVHAGAHALAGTLRWAFAPSRRQ